MKIDLKALVVFITALALMPGAWASQQVSLGGGSEINSINGNAIGVVQITGNTLLEEHEMSNTNGDTVLLYATGLLQTNSKPKYDFSFDITDDEIYGTQSLKAIGQNFKFLTRAISRPDSEGNGIFAETQAIQSGIGKIDYTGDAQAAENLVWASQDMAAKMETNGYVAGMAYTSDYTSDLESSFIPLSINAIIEPVGENDMRMELEAVGPSNFPAILYERGISYPPPVGSDLLKTNVLQKTTIKQSVSSDGKISTINSNLIRPVKVVPQSENIISTFLSNFEENEIYRGEFILDDVLFTCPST